MGMPIVCISGHLSRNVGGQLIPVNETDPKHSVGPNLVDGNFQRCSVANMGIDNEQLSKTARAHAAREQSTTSTNSRGESESVPGHLSVWAPDEPTHGVG